MTTKAVYQCAKCKQVTTFHKEGYPCAYCGHPVIERFKALTNKADNPPRAELTEKSLQHEVELNRKEIMIAFKRLVDIEVRLETIENKLRV